ncbi:heme biosynthesis HemY N-terminal domain-containing protein [Sansalvadorimonas verongulae]|uniref:heme biosynthesis HemY N-terminal domain-containing protein n=1 Tax=Sansalvadorimonas verongulae TaxID=2172824 RepID=UPI0012BC43D3|nr:heme biosynthesis HemY N-terminal domain-containing protein [Sansalvadorimonas verongulae]MTI15306.1 heme biosynthesis protein HemY [Sansalvadorimonas verongulae]
MRQIILKSLFVLLLIAGCFLTVRYFFLDSGYVLVAYNGYTLESSLWASILALAFLLCGLKLALSLIRTLQNGAGAIVPMTAKARRRRGQKLSNKGLIAFANGNWKAAQRHLSQAGQTGTFPLLNYLVAARAASASNDMEACKDFLRKADETAPAAYMAIGITQAEVQSSQGQFEQALATLKSLHKKSPRHPYLLKLLKQTYERLGDWHALAELLPQLRKHKVLDNGALEELEKNIYRELFDQARNKGRNLKGSECTRPADDIWQSLTKAQRRNTDLLYRYALCLFQLGAQEQAEAFIRRQLPALYSVSLIHIYGRIVCTDPSRQLLAAEKLLAERPNDPELLLALGRICSKNQLWGKSREYLETSLKLRHSVDTYNELGILLAQLGEHELSSGYFQKGLTLATDNV